MFWFSLASVGGIVRNLGAKRAREVRRGDEFSALRPRKIQRDKEAFAIATEIGNRPSSTWGVDTWFLISLPVGWFSLVPCFPSRLFVSRLILASELFASHMFLGARELHQGVLGLLFAEQKSSLPSRDFFGSGLFLPSVSALRRACAALEQMSIQ